ncbi:MAG TPA: potassium transporter TrkG, partial [Planctomycetota bacterium]|nr:potassium transporter TrkG [Planctomycetota bacterium]
MIPTRGTKLAPDEALGYDPQTLPSRGRRGKSLGSQIATQISTSDPAQALCGALLAAAPFVLVVTLRTYPPLEAGGAPLAFIAGISSAALLIIGSLSLEYLPRAARTLVTIGIATGAGLAVPTLANSPSLSLLALAGTALALHVLWPSAARRIATPDPRLTALARARVASLVAAGAWLVRAAEEIAPTVDFILAASSAFMLAGLSGLVSIPRMRRSIGRKLIAALFAAATVGLALAGSFGSTVTVLHGAAFAALALAAFARPLPQSKAVETSALDLIAGHPSRLLVVTFLALCALTTFGLSLPACTTGTTPPRLLDLLFTSVSAVCVTGLTVLDTPEAFTRAGQAVILVGIQLGGLGIMTFSTIGIRILGRRMSLRHEAAVAHILSVSDRSKLLRATMTVVVVTFVTEAIGATALSLLFFRDGFSLGEATWRGIFTSVSAFCNAGFALESDSFVSHRTSPLILHSV